MPEKGRKGECVVEVEWCIIFTDNVTVTWKDAEGRREAI
jgi:hypothetical protein